MQNLTNQIVGVLLGLATDAVNEINFAVLGRVVFLAEMSGGGNQGAVSAVIAAKESIFPHEPFRTFAVSVLERLLPHVPATGDVQLVALAANLEANQGIA